MSLKFVRARDAGRSEKNKGRSATTKKSRNSVPSLFSIFNLIRDLLFFSRPSGHVTEVGNPSKIFIIRGHHAIGIDIAKQGKRDALVFEDLLQMRDG